MKDKYKIMKAINCSLTENCMPHINNLNNIIEKILDFEQDMYKRSVFYEINSSLALIRAKICDSLDCFMIKKGAFQRRIQTVKIRDAFWELLSTFSKQAAFKKVMLNIKFEENVPDYCLCDKSRL